MATQRSRFAQIVFFPGIDCTSLKMNAISGTNSATQENVVPPRAAKVKVKNITMNYDQQGAGEPLVLIPYLAADHACYAFQVAEYAKALYLHLARS